MSIEFVETKEMYTINSTAHTYNIKNKYVFAFSSSKRIAKACAVPLGRLELDIHVENVRVKLSCLFRFQNLLCASDVLLCALEDAHWLHFYPPIRAQKL